MPERMTDAEAGYLAGLLDANGSVWIEREKRPSGVYRRLRLRINSLSREQAEWVSRFCRIPFKRTEVGLYSTTFETSAEIAGVFAETHPILIRLRPYAPLVFRFAKTANPSNVDLTDRQHEERAAVEREIEALRKGR